MCECDTKQRHHIRHDKNIGLKCLNGPEESVSLASADSLHLLDFKLKQLKNNTEKLGYLNNFAQLYDIFSRKHTFNAELETRHTNCIYICSIICLYHERIC